MVGWKALTMLAPRNEFEWLLLLVGVGGVLLSIWAVRQARRTSR
jgi:hypothetical protein